MKQENNQYEMIIKIDQNLLRLLPEQARDKLSPEFSTHVSDILRKLFKEVGGVISIMSIGKYEIKIKLKNENHNTPPFQGLINFLNQGMYKEAILLLEAFKSAEPDNVDILYNLGMAYSDLSELNSAQKNLRRLLELKPTHVNGRVALGVALMRDNKIQAAEEELSRAVNNDPENPWAQRNLGACFLEQNKFESALEHLTRATELNSEDERSWYGLGQANEHVGNYLKADLAYRKVLEINEFGNVAEQAKQGLSNIAEKTFQNASKTELRMDAAMYCLSSLQKYDNMTKEEIRQIGFEIAMIGMSGIEVNKPEKQYSLKSLPGKFSGLHLLCLEYVAFKQVQPEMDIGFDLSKEYEMALKLHKEEKKKG